MPAPTDITAANAQTRQPPTLPSELLQIAETHWLFAEDELKRTPSIIDGLPPEKEREYRGKGVNFILQVGIMLKLPQITLATASVFLHRFYMRHPMQGTPGRSGFHHYEVGATSLFLATKVEENCRKMKELVIACVRVAQKDPQKVVDEQDKEYWRWRDVILYNEDVMLEAICFDLSLEPPYKTLFDLLVFFGEEHNKRLRNAAWAFVNDSCLTTLCLLFPSRTIATSSLYAAAKHCDVSFPDDEQGRPWWDVVGVKISDIRKACNYMADIYEGVPSKAGRESGMYERSSEMADDSDDKTRAEGTKRDDGRSPATVNGLIASPTGSQATEGRGSKRGHEDGAGTGQETITNGASYEGNGDESPRKRQRLSNNAAEANVVPTQPEQADDSADAPRSEQVRVVAEHNGTAAPVEETLDGGGLVSPKLDDDVEEGEVKA
ncbi:hypothetical protein ABVK25_005941 [Lepraria finkii]|uniref:RNA polymerase II holoenzyme cyclin-like subunit n=1 Tax=Lepraria finkii TaxID=1340010 RepID=A0ABR4B6Z7_9LECA